MKKILAFTKLLLYLKHIKSTLQMTHVSSQKNNATTPKDSYATQGRYLVDVLWHKISCHSVAFLESYI